MFGPHARDLLDAPRQLHARRLAEQPLHEHDAEEAAGGRAHRRLADEHLAGDARRPVGIAELGERLGDRVVGTEDDDLGREHAARRALLVREQARHDLGLVVVHRREDRRALLERHLVQQVGEVVVLHLVEHVDDAVEVEPLDQAQLLLLGELLEQVGEPVVVHRRRQLAALRQRQRAHDAGDVGRVHVAQAGGLGRGLVRRRPELGHLAPLGEPEVRAPAQRVAPGEPDRGHLPAPDAPVLDLAQADVADASRRARCGR